MKVYQEAWPFVPYKAVVIKPSPEYRVERGFNRKNQFFDILYTVDADGNDTSWEVGIINEDLTKRVRK